MKKLLLFFAVALFALGIHAQGYNIIVTTSTGTQIALPANEISSISFNNGQLVITGTDIAKLVTTQTLDSVRQESQNQLYTYLATIQEHVNYLVYLTRGLQDSVEVIKRNGSAQGVDSLGKKHDADMAQVMNGLMHLEKNNYDTRYTLTDSIAALRQTIAAIKTAVNPDSTDYSKLQQQINDLTTSVTAYQVDVNSRIDNIQSDVTRVNTDWQNWAASLQTQLSSMMQQMDDLQKKLDSHINSSSSAKSK